MSYAEHTIWSDPGAFRPRLLELPSSPVELADALENFLIHHAAARFLKFGVPDYAEADRNLRTVGRLLDMAFARDDRPLTAHRDLPAYLYGTCHDFALIATSLYRSLGIEARLRVGFAGYFITGRWEDHWLCEYRSDGVWRLLDAQLGRRAREGHGIAFDVADVPRQRFLTAAELWLGIRQGEIDPAACGVNFAGISGVWFPAASVLRDAATLSGIEPLPWDYWGPARSFVETRIVPEAAALELDALAAAFAEPPASPEAGRRLLDERFPWAVPEETVLSAVRDVLVERPLV